MSGAPGDGPLEAGLYLVATPIGNLEDITLRAVRVLRSCTRVVAEDTRRTRALLSHLGIAKPIESLHAHSSERDVLRLAEALSGGEALALVTDAGTPVVSDPGDALTRAAIDRGIRVVPIPGPSAVLAALVGSGLAGEAGFRFVGFLPREGMARHTAIARVADTNEAVVLFESPNRTGETLRDLAFVMPSRPVCVARELTKRHEEFVRGTLEELASTAREWIGEVVIVLGEHAARTTEAIGDAALDERIDAELEAGAHAKTLAERLAAWSGRPKRDVYERIVRRKQSRRS